MIHKHSVDYASDRAARFYKKWWWSDDNEFEASASPLLWHRRKGGHGWGFQFGVNGDESDCGLDIHLGRVASVWLRLRSRWTKWMQLKDYDVRHIGFRFRPYEGAAFRWELWAKAHSWSSSDPCWMSGSVTPNTFFGKNDGSKTVEDSGATQIPMPEGNYLATWERVRYETRYTGRLGKVRDAVFGPRSHVSYWLDIPGGIPVEGKGENSWDCGMDGIFGTGGRSLEDAIGNAVRSVMRDRKRYGGPHDLTRPTSVKDLT